MQVHKIRSNLPGTVGYHHVDDGAKVEKGDKVVSIECMKTMYDFEAPAAGIVRHVVQLGTMVEQDQVVSQIESE